MILFSVNSLPHANEELTDTEISDLARTEAKNNPETIDEIDANSYRDFGESPNNIHVKMHCADLLGGYISGITHKKHCIDIIFV